MVRRSWRRVTRRINVLVLNTHWIPASAAVNRFTFHRRAVCEPGTFLPGLLGPVNGALALRDRSLRGPGVPGDAAVCL